MHPEQPLALDRAQLLLTVLDEGRRTATYKLAVLLALLDCCTVSVDEHGKARGCIPTQDLAARVIELYYAQVRPWNGPDGPRVLRQSTQARAVTLDAVEQLRRDTGAASAAAARQRDPSLFETTVRTVELNLVRMPLGKLQRPANWVEGSSPPYPRFLYDDGAFTESVTARALLGRPWAVDLHAGVADWLVSLSGLVRPLVELHWTREVVRWNKLQLADDQVHEHLFGAQRIDLGRVRTGLRALQAGACFYCRTDLDEAGEVDHVVPWSRVPNDALGNLVLAHRACNGNKREHLLAVDLVQRWAERDQAGLHQLSEDIRWPLEQERSWRLARGVYSHLADATPLWRARGVFDVFSRSARERTLRLLPD